MSVMFSCLIVCNAQCHGYFNESGITKGFVICAIEFTLGCIFAIDLASGIHDSVTSLGLARRFIQHVHSRITTTS